MQLEPYIFKTPPYEHQERCFYASRDKEIYAILFEMGAGKSKVAVDTAAYLHSKGRIDAVVLIAPNGVHTKWLAEDFPLSMPDWNPWKGAAWEAGNKKAEQACEDLLKPGPELRILCMNVEAFSTKRGQEFAKRFLQATDSLMIVDESSRIKNPDAKRTISICKLGDYAKYRRILTGTPYSNSPFDIYAQFMFLDPSILGQSYYAFKAEYAEIIPKDDPFITTLMKKNNLKFAPQLVAKDKTTGKAKYRNLDKLKKLIEPYSMRVTKEECLDLPPKIYQTRYFKLPAPHRKAYDQLKAKSKVELTSGEKLTVMHKLTLMLRLQQVAGGFMPTDDRDLIHLYSDPKENPRIQCLMDTLEDVKEEEGGVIIWCRFIEEIKLLKRLLGDEAVEYYGDVSNADRVEAKRAFQAGEKKYFLANVATGGIGINLTKAATVIFYSNTFSYEDRKQAEDRAHRIGQIADKVNIIDLQAEDTCDGIIVRALRNKEDVANYMTDMEWVQ
jgi:SNF2 family DNA or RNA helicase